MSLAVEGDLLGMEYFSARTEFQSDGSVLALEHAGERERTVDWYGGSRIGLADACTGLLDTEKRIRNRGKLGQSFLVCQLGEVQVRACGGLGKVAQVGVLGYGGGIQGVDWGFALQELGLTEIGYPVGAEEELVAGIFRQVDDPELSCAIVR